MESRSCSIFSHKLISISVTRLRCSVDCLLVAVVDSSILVKLSFRAV